MLRKENQGMLNSRVRPSSHENEYPGTLEVQLLKFHGNHLFHISLHQIIKSLSPTDTVGTIFLSMSING